jgi:acetolactate synthase I/II/III large subunit
VNGAERLCDALSARGVECVFGLPGTQNTALYEALRRSRLRSVVPTHELAASFMANGYYRASGRPGVLITIPGPGFAYAVPGLAEARHDSAALLHITGAPPGGERRLQFQALDQRGMVHGLVKGVFRADHPDEMASAAASALALATRGEPGPVQLEHSVGALTGGASRGDGVPFPGDSLPVMDEAGLDGAIAMLAASRRPVIMAGQGCVGAHAALRELVELLGAPIFTTVSGRGILPEDHALALGFEFARGDVRALNGLLRTSDCLLVIGCKLTEAGTDGFRLELPADRLLHVDASAEVLGATYAERLSVAAPAELFLDRIVPALRRLRKANKAAWSRDEVDRWRKRLHALTPDAAQEPALTAGAPRTVAALFAALRRALPRDGIVVTDSGLHQTLTRRHLEVYSPRGLIVPSDFQSMGFGLPAAIGAKLAAPKRAVVAVIGDAGFAMSGMELLTAVRERVAVTVLVFNDGQMNRIRLQQLAQYGHPSGCEVLSPDFEAFARAAGIGYARAGADVEATLRTAVGQRSPTLVEVALRDSPAIHSVRARGLVRGVARRALRSGLLQWLRP